MIVDKIKQRQKIKLKIYNANVENITKKGKTIKLTLNI